MAKFCLRPFSLVLIVAGGISNPSAATDITSPNLAELTLYNSETNPSDKLTIQKFSDGMGRGIRTLTPDGANDIVTGTFYDVFGRVQGQIKPYSSSSQAHAWKNGVDIIAEANTYYNGTVYRPNASNKAYSEVVYYEDPLQRAKMAGEPGYDFSVARNSGASAKRSWFFSIATPTCVSNPNDAALNAKTDDANALYRLDISRDGSGNFAQSIKDLTGNEIKKCSDPSSTAGNEIVAEYLYSKAGELLSVKYPGTGGLVDPSMSSSYIRSASGQLLSETHPDLGKVEYVYDRGGRLRFTRDEKQRIDSDIMAFNYTKYDALGRITEIGTVGVAQSDFTYYFSSNRADEYDWPSQSGVIINPMVRYWYDSNEGAAEFLGGDESYFQGSNLNGRLAGQAAYSQGLSGVGDVVLDSYSYNADGQLAWNWKIAPGIRLHQFDYKYDIQGRLITKAMTNGPPGSQPTTSQLKYSYDGVGRLSRVSKQEPNGSFTALVDYSYSPTGELVGKDFFKAGGSVGAIDISYNIRGWVSTVDAFNASSALLYSQKNSYNELGGTSGPQFNGNISSSTFTYNLPGSQARYAPSYYYDGANRLIAAYDPIGPSYEYEGFEYDSKSRLVKKKENGALYGPYVYASGTNRVTQVLAHPTRNTANNFVYDPNGNMVFDRSKSMGVRYDWRNLPVAFRFYNSIPVTVSWQQAMSLPNARAEVEMVYDANGSRVVKRTTKF